MAVKIIELTSIEARRFSKRGEKFPALRIDNTSTVTAITEISDKEANIEFRFTTSYGAIGTIKIEGKLTFEGNASELATQWSQTMNMPENVANEVHNAIMQTCLPETVFLARDLHLPPPIPLPHIDIKKRKEGKVGGPEVA
ncbi:MAG: hypothetical protein QMC98_02290 [Candidatus Thermoplasmatota archaeon]|nr:hypothetical protein [Candidatus Thermoplasmatota archaeon]MDI6887456.1 hypothetical protein [Candidatus Thermoplasmatota archaeon]